MVTSASHLLLKSVSSLKTTHMFFQFPDCSMLSPGSHFLSQQTHIYIYLVFTLLVLTFLPHPAVVRTNPKLPWAKRKPGELESQWPLSWPWNMHIPTEDFSYYNVRDIVLNKKPHLRVGEPTSVAYFFTFAANLLILSLASLFTSQDFRSFPSFLPTSSLSLSLCLSHSLSLSHLCLGLFNFFILIFLR
jgi:hypothetical protein